MSIYQYLRRIILEEHPQILEQYQIFLDKYGNDTFSKRVVAYMYLLKLYLLYNKQTKSIELRQQESSLSKGDIEKEYSEIKACGIVSFDVFDTLVIRTINKPIDVFEIIGIKLGIPGFSAMRIEAEQIVRANAKTTNGEVNIYDIYNELEKHCDLVAEKGVRAEFETEKEICVKNPYIYKLYQKLIAQGKKIIAISDMYLTEEMIRELLINSGYDEISDIFVSNKYGESKANGGLYRIVEAKYQTDIVHIGDNLASDVHICNKTKRFRGILYNNVYLAGTPYRVRESNSLANKIYSGLVNFKVHNGCCSMSQYEEYGYVYAGILTVGYCNWLNKLAKERNIDQFLFVARDGHIIQQVYNKYYLEVDNEYVYLSRFAAIHIVPKQSVDFIISYIRKRVFGSRMSVKYVLEDLDIGILAEFLLQRGINLDEELNKKNSEQIIEVLIDHINDVEKSYENSQRAAEKYFKNIIGQHKRVCLVDVGWVGTNTVLLKHFLEKKCNLDIEVLGAHIGTAYNKNNIEAIEAKTINSYCFSPTFNVDLMKLHGIGINNVLFEIIYSAPHGSLLNYKLDGEEVDFIFANQCEENIKITNEIHNGILEFAEEYQSIVQKLQINVEISGRDAYLSISKAMGYGHFLKELFENYIIQELPAMKSATVKKVGQMLEEQKCV